MAVAHSLICSASLFNRVARFTVIKDSTKLRVLDRTYNLCDSYTYSNDVSSDKSDFTFKSQNQ